ncbi:MAG: HlyC/CorC family transporter [Ardenticatenales bacterium]|nr:HlyC/CorC family transporter [Ardenticatenales bacterium]
MDVDSIWAALFIMAGALLLIIALAAAEAALSTISRTRLRMLSTQGKKGAEIALRLIDDMAKLRTALSLLNMLLAAVLTAAALIVSAYPGGNAITTVVAILLAALLLQSMGAAAGTRWYHYVAPGLAPMTHMMVLMIFPLHRLLTGLNRRLSGTPELEGEEALRLGEEELRALATVVGEGDDIAEEGREMIYSIVTLSQTTVREVMVPRLDIVALRSDVSMLGALDSIIRVGHSRIPVYADNIDNIIGILYAKDLLAYLRDGRTDVPIRDLLRPAIFVPTSKMADELLQDLQGGRVHLAIVFDEYGGTAGLVTIEDILEEIVGEIQDEYDAEEEALVVVSPYEAMVSGRLDIDDLNHEMDIELPTDENDTVGGLIYSALGRVPLVGDEVRMEEAGATFRVVGMVGRRIANVRVLVDHVEPASSGGGPLATEELEQGAKGQGSESEVGLSRLLFRLDR